MKYFDMHKDAYVLIFKRGWNNFIQLVLFALMFAIAVAIPFLTPIAMIASVSFFIAFLDKGEANLFETLKKVDMTADRYIKLMITTLLYEVVLIAGYMLFFVPGVIFTFALAPLFYLIVNKPNISTSDAFTSSFEMMKGHKLELFFLQLVGELIIMVFMIAYMILNYLLVQIWIPLSLILGLGLLVIMPLLVAELQLVQIIFFKSLDNKETKVIETEEV